jgi:C-terminal domain 6 of the ABC-three component (ABC-3C) systems
MTGDVRYDRLILLMDDHELEKFCRAWADKKSGYVEVKRYAGSGDMGRDVVGFLTDERHDGAWDNYQCKQYLRGVSRPQGLLAIGKVLYWASRGKFAVPRNFYFVAPKGLARKLELLIDKPSELKKALIDDWHSVCAKAITAKTVIPLDATLKGFIENYDFKNVRVVTIDDMMNDPAVKPLLIEKFGADPGKYPPATVPVDVQGIEMRYISELVSAYCERAKILFADHDAILADADHGPDFRRQRERFFEADAFQKFYRDNTSATVISSFRNDVRFGVVDRWNAPAADTLGRVEAVMERAGMVMPAGPLAKYAHVPVKQGMCHHFVNDGEMSWNKKL